MGRKGPVQPVQLRALCPGGGFHSWLAHSATYFVLFFSWECFSYSNKDACEPGQSLPVNTLLSSSHSVVSISL